MNNRDNLKKEISTYEIAAFVNKEMAAQWQTAPELIRVALEKGGKLQYTKEQAKKIVEHFKHKEVL